MRVLADIASSSNGSCTIANVGDDTFGNASVASMSVPTNLAIINSGYFNDYDGLADIAVARKLTALTASVFTGYATLRSVAVPRNVNIIPTSYFSKYADLTAISLPDALTSGTAARRSNVRDETFVGYATLAVLAIHTAAPTSVTAGTFSNIALTGIGLCIPYSTMRDCRRTAA